jgi:hypothetical protein
MKIKHSKITLLVCSFLVMVMFSIVLNIKPDRAEQTTTSSAPIDTISIKKTIFDSLLKRFCEGSITQAYTSSQTNEGYVITFNNVKDPVQLFNKEYAKLFLEPNIVKNGFYAKYLDSNKVNVQLVMLDKNGYVTVPSGFLFKLMDPY